MKKTLEIIFSTKTTVVLLLVLAIAMGVATFVEDRYDTATAKQFIYNAKWFELLFLLLALNFIGNIQRYHLLRKGKLAGLLFHSAFIILIIGAGVTRYTGFEGIMNIRENEQSDVLILDEGKGERKLPFSIFLNDFILDRYAGSMSPSSFVSEITLIDKRKNSEEKHTISMNNVLDYDGYRFFQSSYDQDEKGTILSVNHDFWGTWISYTGYFLLGVGFFFTLFNKNSRFIALSHFIEEIRKTRKELIGVILFLLVNNFSFSQKINSCVSKKHAEQFSHLLVQTYDGRFEPVHTLASDVFHKISRKNEFEIKGKGEMDVVQVMMDMLLNREFWKQQKIIYVREKSVAQMLSIEGNYASFNHFFDGNGNYKLAEFAENAFHKPSAEQNTFDKEILKVDERVNICLLVFQGTILKIFPEQNSENNKWLSWDDTLAYFPLTGSIQILNEDLQLQEFNYSNLFGLYLTEVFNATHSGDYSRAEKISGHIHNIQRQSTAAPLLPTPKMVDWEIYYNNAQIFIRLRNWFGILCLPLLILAFLSDLKINKIIGWLLNFFILLLAACFLYHTWGMGLRWYLTGHAPWSNGYEALLLIAWGGLLAGFCFLRSTKITLAATTFLAFFTLLTASHSSYDPQLTNLVPVLKSYWLIIHVAVMTVSYGFLGLGFILGLLNLLIFLFKKNKNAARMDLLIQELTFINEMNLTIGLFLAVLGTFLGGIWANESWGRYWGWDAKETWALVIVIIYTVILHLRLVPKMNSIFIFNAASVLAFGTVIMTFIGVNYYLSKGMHSYASGDTPVFPLWAWAFILSLLFLIGAVGWREKVFKRN